MVGREVSPARVRAIMDDQCNTSYKNSVSESVNVNEDVFKFKRHYYSKHLLELMSDDIIFVSYDESAIEHLNFQRKAHTTRGVKFR